MSVDTVRRAALLALTGCRRRGSWMEAALAEQTHGFSTRDAAFCTWLCYGVVQNKRLLDYFLQAKSKLPLSKIEPQVLDCLRLGVFQLWGSETIPPSAAVNETVKLVRSLKNGARAVGFVNALLRALSDKNWHYPPKQPTEAYCAIRYSLPDWLVHTFIQRLGTDEAEALCQALNTQPPVALQFDGARTDKEALRAELTDHGLTARDHVHWHDCLLVDSAASLTSLPSWRNGEIWVSDVAARLAIHAAQPMPGMSILDACAAPGGKTLALAAALGGKGAITACDIQPHKVQALRETLERTGYPNVTAQLKDAASYNAAWAQAYDLVVADLPCSGLGVMAKKPDIRTRTESEIAHLPTMQLDFLHNLSNYVKPGGKLLYITCTLLQAENEAVAEAFTAAHDDFMPHHFEIFSEKVPYITLWPHRYDTDGFFFALWEKKHEN